jgi:uncharacterized membrane protein YjfL (UPF0719 family)
MEMLIALFSGFISWSVLFWVLGGLLTIGWTIILKEAANINLSNLMLHWHGLAVMIAIVVFFSTQLLANASEPSVHSDHWTNMLIGLFSIHSAIINGLLICAHYRVAYEFDTLNEE